MTWAFQHNWTAAGLWLVLSLGQVYWLQANAADQKLRPSTLLDAAPCNWLDGWKTMLGILTDTIKIAIIIIITAFKVHW